MSVHTIQTTQVLMQFVEYLEIHPQAVAVGGHAPGGRLKGRLHGFLAATFPDCDTEELLEYASAREALRHLADRNRLKLNPRLECDGLWGRLRAYFAFDEWGKLRRYPLTVGPWWITKDDVISPVCCDCCLRCPR